MRKQSGGQKDGRQRKIGRQRARMAQHTVKNQHHQDGHQEDDALVLDDARKADEVAVQGKKHGGDPAGQWVEETPAQQPHGKERRQIGDGKGQTGRCLGQVAGGHVEHRGQQNLGRAFFVQQQDILVALQDGGRAQRSARLVALKIGVAKIDQAEDNTGGQQHQCAHPHPAPIHVERPRRRARLNAPPTAPPDPGQQHQGNGVVGQQRLPLRWAAGQIGEEEHDGDHHPIGGGHRIDDAFPPIGARGTLAEQRLHEQRSRQEAGQHERRQGLQAVRQVDKQGNMRQRRLHSPPESALCASRVNALHTIEAQPNGGHRHHQTAQTSRHFH